MENGGRKETGQQAFTGLSQANPVAIFSLQLYSSVRGCFMLVEVKSVPFLVGDRLGLAL